MKAALFEKIGAPLKIIDSPDPKPLPDEVVVSVGRCGICGSDLHLTEAGGMEAQPGSVLGHELAGEVVAVGKDVSNFKMGDRVAALPTKGCGKCTPCKAGEPYWCEKGMEMLEGGFAQFARAGAAQCLLLPGQLNMTDGALAEPLAVSLHGLRSGPELKGKTVTVIGAGPIGLASVFWARQLGANLVQVVEGNPSRVEIAMNMGANKGFGIAPAGAAGDPTTQPVPADVVIECVGKPGLLTAAIERTKPRGTVISLGFCMGPEEIVAMSAAAMEITLKFPILYNLEDYKMTLDALSSGAVEARNMVTDTIALAQLPQTLEALRAPGHQCKVMVDPWTN